MSNELQLADDGQAPKDAKELLGESDADNSITF